MGEPLVPEDPDLRLDFRAPMERRDVQKIARELCALLQEQMDTLAEDNLADLCEAELAAYQMRKEKIRELRAELETHAQRSC